MTWRIITADLPPGRYQVLTKDGVELGLCYRGGYWLDNGGAPIKPTHYATIADVLSATNGHDPDTSAP